MCRQLEQARDGSVRLIEDLVEDLLLLLDELDGVISDKITGSRNFK